INVYILKCTPMLIGLRLITVQKSSYRVYFLDFFTCLLYSCLGTSLKFPRVVVQHCSGPFFIVSLFHSYDIFTKTFDMFITNHATVVREEIQMRMKEMDLLRHNATKFLILHQHVLY